MFYISNLFLSESLTRSFSTNRLQAAFTYKVISETAASPLKKTYENASSRLLYSTGSYGPNMGLSQGLYSQLYTPNQINYCLFHQELSLLREQSFHADQWGPRYVAVETIQLEIRRGTTYGVESYCFTAAVSEIGWFQTSLTVSCVVRSVQADREDSPFSTRRIVIYATIYISRESGNRCLRH